jgi:hypothetical protein
MSVIFIDSEHNYVYNVLDNFVIGQIATSFISWQDYNNTRSSVWKRTLHAQIM